MTLHITDAKNILLKYVHIAHYTTVVLSLSSYGDLQSFARLKKHKTYILKPESGCQGKGIWVTKNPKDIKPQEHMLCQQYVSKVSWVKKKK